MRQSIKLTIFILTICLFLFAPIAIYAQENPYRIVLSDPTYNYIKTVGGGTQIFEYFNINVTLRNLGANESDQITIELIDQDNIQSGVKRYYTFSPLEKKTFLFADHPISGTGDHNITIKFYPTNETKNASYNSGSGTFVIYKNDSEGGSTPGFEITLIIITFALFVFLKKKTNFWTITP